MRQKDLACIVFVPEGLQQQQKQASQTACSGNTEGGNLNWPRMAMWKTPKRIVCLSQEILGFKEYLGYVSCTLWSPVR